MVLAAQRHCDGDACVNAQHQLSNWLRWTLLAQIRWQESPNGCNKSLVFREPVEFTLDTVSYMNCMHVSVACQWESLYFFQRVTLETLQTFDQSAEIRAEQPNTKTETMKKKDTDNDNEMKRPFRKHPKVKIMMLHDCTWCYQVCQMRTSRDLSQFRFHPILPRQVVSCKTIIDMEPDSIHIARLSMFSQIHLTLLSWNLILFYTAKICQMGK